VVKAGQEIAKGTHLYSIEAMKMETAVHAERDLYIEEVVIAPGTQVKAHDLLFVVR